MDLLFSLLQSRLTNYNKKTGFFNEILERFKCALREEFDVTYNVKICIVSMDGNFNSSEV